jgi:general stress protein YciG
MDQAKQRQIASKGGQSVPPEKRSFSQDPQLAAQAGRKGGEAVPPEGRSFSQNRELAAEAGRKGGQARGAANRSEASGAKTSGRDATAEGPPKSNASHDQTSGGERSRFGQPPSDEASSKEYDEPDEEEDRNDLISRAQDIERGDLAHPLRSPRLGGSHSHRSR